MTRGVDRREATDAERGTARVVAGDSSTGPSRESTVSQGRSSNRSVILTGLLRESQHQATERSPGVSISLIEFRPVTRGVDCREATDAERSTARAVAGRLETGPSRESTVSQGRSSNRSVILTGLLRESQHQATERSPGVSISLIEFRPVTRGVDRREATDAERSTARAVAGDSKPGL